MVAAGKLKLSFDARLLGEYGDVLSRPKFDFRAEHVEALVEQIRAGGASASAEPLSRPLPDRDDEPFLEVALAAAADYLVTGNPRHYPAPLRSGVRVVTPAEFVEIIRELGE